MRMRNTGQTETQINDKRLFEIPKVRQGNLGKLSGRQSVTIMVCGKVNWLSFAKRDQNDHT